MDILKILQQEFNIKQWQAEAAIKLIYEGIYLFYLNL